MGRHILLLGIGQTGCAVAELFAQKKRQEGDMVLSFAIDTDESTLSSLTAATAIPMVDEGTLGTVVEALGAENLIHWFPCDWENDQTEFVKNLRMNHGANQWRMKALLSFASFLGKEKALEAWHARMDTLLNACEDTSGIELYTVASLAGGTGAGLFLPLALYVKQYLQGAGGKLLSSTAMLAMPDLYESVLSAEQRVKSYANAYAALRELHAVNRTANPGASEEEMCAPIHFRIGSENDPCLGSLFDSEKEAYRTPSAMPFDRVYLMERVPGIQSVGTHTSLMAELLDSLCTVEALSSAQETPTLTTTDAVYGALSLTKVLYPVESIVNYIEKKQFFDEADQEWLTLYRRVKDTLLQKRKEARAYGRSFSENTASFCESFIALAETMAEEGGCTQAILNRNRTAESAEDPTEAVWYMAYETFLSEALDPLSDSDSAQSLLGVIEGRNTCQGDSADGKKPLPLKASERKTNLIANAQKCRGWLDSCYRDVLAVVLESQTAPNGCLPSKADENGNLALPEELWKPEGVFLHPLYALLRLCLLYREMESFTHRNEALLRTCLQAEKEDEIPPELLMQEPLTGSKCRYSKGGEGRLAALLQGKKSLAGSDAEDEALFRRDLLCVYERLKKLLRIPYGKAVMASLEKRIQAYRAFFDGLDARLGERSTDVRLALLANSEDNGIVVSIGSTVEEKKELYAAYKDAYDSDAVGRRKQDAYLGQRVSAWVLAVCTKKEPYASIDALLAELEASFGERCRQSAFYREHLDKNILAAITNAEAKPNRAFGQTLRKAFKAKPVYLRHRTPEPRRDALAVKTVSTALLPHEAEHFLAEASERFSNRTPQAAAEQLMFRAGEYQGQARFIDALPANCLYMRRETIHLPLAFSQAVDELSEDPIGYRCYRKALQTMQTHLTQMWNPHLGRNDYRQGRLPYINPNQQKRYETMAAEAALYALMTQELTVEPLTPIAESSGNIAGKAYFVRSHGLWTPLYWEDEPIFENEPDRLWQWILQNDDWLTKQGRAFEELSARERQKLPAAGIGDWNYRALSERIGQTKVIAALRKYLFPLAYALKKAEDASVPHGYAIRLLSVGYETLLSYCRNRSDEEDDRFIGLYHTYLTRFVEDFLNDVSWEEAEAFVAWMNAQGVFCAYSAPERLCEYEFSAFLNRSAEAARE